MTTKTKSEYACEQCNDTGWANVKKADGSSQKVLCYCHPLVASGKIKPLSGSCELDKYLKTQHKTKRR